MDDTMTRADQVEHARLARLKISEPTGIACECGHYTKFPAYVYAHWDIKLRFTCPDCKTRYEVLRGDIVKL